MISLLLTRNIKFMQSNISQIKPVICSYVNYVDGPPNKMSISQRQIKCQQGQLLMKIKAIGINRAQCLQRKGQYPSLKPSDKYLGLEASGEVYDPVTHQKLFDGMALLSGGSYAQWASIHQSHIMKLPPNLSYIEGAAIPEGWLTAFQLLRYANLSEGQSVVIYAAASGVGTAAIQICSILNIKAFGVCSSQQKGKTCVKLGAQMVYYKQNQNWAEDLLKMNNQKNFNAVLDCVGSSNVDHTLKLLSVDGKWIQYGLLSGGKTNLNLGALLAKRIHLITTTLKTRSDEYKDQLINDFTKAVYESLSEGKVKPIIFKTLISDWSNAQTFIQAHELMESNQNAGKIIIEFK